jgi:DNA-directed RNA polymerase subunit L
MVTNRIIKRASHYLQVEIIGGINNGLVFKISPEDETIIQECTWYVVKMPKQKDWYYIMNAKKQYLSNFNIKWLLKWTNSHKIA